MHTKHIIAAIGISIGLTFVANASYIHIKARLAQVLIASAFAEQAKSAILQRPWPWADTKVLVKLSIGEHTNYVLSHASMRNLAFGPTHVSQTAFPGHMGNSVILGHRDTHFHHLQDVKIGETIKIDDGTEVSTFMITEIMVVDKHEMAVMQNTDSSALTLITCYPFNAITNDPDQRFVVRAIKTFA